MADIEAHIGAGVIDSHCDCNFFINTYRWDFPQVAALAAPRPLLIGGTDQDRIFPLATTLRIHEKLRKVYEQYNARDRLGLVIAPGPHDETPELRLAAMRWFNRHLKGRDAPVRHVAERLFEPEQLKVFQVPPEDAINTNIAQTFVQPLERRPTGIEELRAELRKRVFAGWPEEVQPPRTRQAWSVVRDGLQFAAWDFESQPAVRLRVYSLSRPGGQARDTRFTVLDQDGWTRWLGAMRTRFGPELREELAASPGPPGEAGPDPASHVGEANALVFFAPRGVGLTRWAGDAREFTRIRRRFMLLGQTVDGMRVWDIRRAIQVLRETGFNRDSSIELSANGTMAVNALYASLFEESAPRLRLEGLPDSQLDGPDYLNVLRVADPVKERRHAR
jgi:hypothetical protein